MMSESTRDNVHLPPPAGIICTAHLCDKQVYIKYNHGSDQTLPGDKRHARESNLIRQVQIEIHTAVENWNYKRRDVLSLVYFTGNA